MLIEFSVENYRSIAERQTLSMVASSRDKKLKNTNTFKLTGAEKLELVKSAVIYGANASGKTNILQGLAILQNLVFSSAKRMQINDKIEVEPFKLDLEWLEKPTVFEIIFIQDNIRYQYFVSLDQTRIYEESLYAYPKGRAQCWYEREYNKEKDEYNWYFGNQLKGEKSIISKLVRPNSLFLSHAAQNNHEQLTSVFNWFNRTLYPIDFKPDISPFYYYALADYTANLCYDSNEIKSLITQFLAKADIDIEDIKIEVKDIEEMRNTNKIYNKSFFLPDKVLSIKTVRRVNNSEKLVEFYLKDESNGTQRLFDLAGFLVPAIISSRIIVVDELAKSLHPAVSILIAQLFNSQDNNKGGQLIFNTHDTTLLDKTIFRRDQIWFTEKNENRATELYSLSEFKPIKNESLQKGYLQGRYGAIPFIGKFQF